MTEKNIEYKTAIELQDIQILEMTINSQDPSLPNAITHQFNISALHQSIDDQSLLVCTLAIEVLAHSFNIILGSVKVNYIFLFPDVVKYVEAGKLNLPTYLINYINTISISTTRGVMATAFRGTHLQKAFLPLIDPQGFKSPMA